jgi:hypothetical protein
MHQVRKEWHILAIFGREKLKGKKHLRRCELHPIGLRQGPVVGSSENNHEPLESIKPMKVLDQTSNYQLLKKDSAPWR